jgi:polyisoprenoid-binding protein YceI
MKTSVFASPVIALLLLASCGSSTGSKSSGAAETPDTTAAAPVTAEVPAPVEAPTTAEAPVTAEAPAATEVAAAATTVAAAVGAPVDGGVDGEWKVAAGSEAGYRVPEILQGQKIEAVGRTPGVTGSMTVAGSAVTAAAFTFDMTKLASDSGKRDNQVQTRIMKTAEFPTATFTATGPIEFGKAPAEGETVSAKAVGDLMMHGTTKPVTVDVQARRKGANVEVLGSLEITFAEWGIENPSIKPFVEVGEKGTIEWLLVMAK